jgi:carbamoyltransferase
MASLILGLNSAHADTSAFLVGERGVLAAIAEERINRKKHCADFPKLAILEVLRLAGASISDVTDIAVARDPRANLLAKGAFVGKNPFQRVPRALGRLRVHRAVSNSAELVADALGTSASQVRARFHQVEHHLAHVASAFYWSNFERATGLTVDGAGDFATSMLATCAGTDVEIRRRTFWPHSLGVLYTAVCQFIGFDRFGEEYKVMGLSAYGVNRFARQMRELVRFDPYRGIRLNLSYFRHHVSNEGFEKMEQGEITIPRLWGDRFEELFGPARHRSAPLSDRDRDLAASLQIRFEEIYLALAEDAARVTGIRDVVMAGGSVLNSVGNGRLLTEGVIDRAYFHPAASDDGTAAGAALHVLHAKLKHPRTGHVRHAYWGTEWSDDEIEKAVVASGLPFRKLDRANLLATAAESIAKGKIVGWFQGREEWGPRALGNRSIVCHPGWPDMKAILNARIKNREPFRPFAPSIRREKLSTCFMGDHEVPFMIVVYKVRPEWKERLSAITHEDGTGRVQTVEREANPLYYDLISAFEARTGIPVLLNTSFNENEPIVHTPAQAIDCFARTRMESLGIGSFWLEKEGASAGAAPG